MKIKTLTIVLFVVSCALKSQAYFNSDETFISPADNYYHSFSNLKVNSAHADNVFLDKKLNKINKYLIEDKSFLSPRFYDKIFNIVKKPGH